MRALGTTVETMDHREGVLRCIRWCRAALIRLSLGIVGLGIGCECLEGTEIRSVSFSGTNILLNLSSDWDRRYRIEASSDLTIWRTVLITEPSQGVSLVAGVPTAGATSSFFKASLFEWEELHAEWLLARQRWQGRGLSTYQFECRWNCNCPFWGWARVQVQDGVVTEVVAVDTGKPLPKEQWSMYLTIDGLFDWIESRRELHPVELQASFDPVLGYPISGYADLSRNLADEELGFEIRALTF